VAFPRSLGGAGFPGRCKAPKKLRQWGTVLLRQYNNYTHALPKLYKHQGDGLKQILPSGAHQTPPSGFISMIPDEKKYVPVPPQDKPFSQLNEYNPSIKQMMQRKWQKAINTWETSLATLSSLKNKWNLKVNKHEDKEVAAVHDEIIKLPLDRFGVRRHDLLQDLTGNVLYRLKVTSPDLDFDARKYIKSASRRLNEIQQLNKRKFYIPVGLRPSSSSSLKILDKLSDDTCVSPLAAQELRRKVQLRPVSADGTLYRITNGRSRMMGRHVFLPVSNYWKRNAYKSLTRRNTRLIPVSKKSTSQG